MQVRLNQTKAEKNYDISGKLVTRLLNPDAYPHSCHEKIRIIETHSAWLLLTGDVAYKIKKPVNFGFLDFSTLSKRRRFCKRELRLNSKIAPQIYLEVVEIREDERSVRVGSASGTVLEYAVKMRQFADNSLLVDLIKDHRLSESHIDSLSAQIADQHSTAKQSPVSCDFGSPELIRRWTAESFSHINEIAVPTYELNALAYLKTWTEYQSQRLCDVFIERKKDGKVRDCHGDLHLGNLVLIENSMVPFDRIEFNDELRWIDTINEIAFLIMDLSEHKRLDLANRFLNRYLQVTGDYAGLEVLAYYLVYRALVRAKVAALRRQQLPPAGEAYAEKTRECMRYVDYAKQCSVARSAKLIITHGVSGAGKSYLAERLAEQLGAIQIRSDLERKRLSQDSGGQPHPNALNSGNYRPEKRDAVYAHMLFLAAKVLNAGYSVILDATFLQKKYRKRARDLASRKLLPFLLIDCQAPNDVLVQRIRHRSMMENDASEATEEVLHSQLGNAEPIDKDEEPFVLRVNTHFDDITEPNNNVDAIILSVTAVLEGRNVPSANTA